MEALAQLQDIQHRNHVTDGRISRRQQQTPTHGFYTAAKAANQSKIIPTRYASVLQDYRHPSDNPTSQSAQDMEDTVNSDHQAIRHQSERKPRHHTKLPKLPNIDYSHLSQPQIRSNYDRASLHHRSASSRRSPPPSKQKKVWVPSGRSVHQSQKFHSSSFHSNYLSYIRSK